MGYGWNNHHQDFLPGIIRILHPLIFGVGSQGGDDRSPNVGDDKETGYVLNNGYTMVMIGLERAFNYGDGAGYIGI